jgi:hypothetical protein
VAQAHERGGFFLQLVEFVNRSETFQFKQQDVF